MAVDHTHTTHDDAAHEHPKHHHVNYLLIFAALCVLTGLSIVTDVVKIDSKAVLIVLVLAIATAKALFVMMYFMHLKFEGNWKYVLLAPTIILAMGVPLALMPDIGLHYYYQLDAPDQPAVMDATNLGEETPANERGH